MNGGRNFILVDHYPYPVFIRLNGRKCVVVGGGKIASRKISDLLESGAEVTVIAEIPDRRIKELAEKKEITLYNRRFEPGDIEGAFLVFAATDNDSVNAEIADIGSEAGALVNAVDNPSHCDFFSAGVVKRGPLRIAVSTSGFCPAVAAGIRRELEELFSKSYGDYLVFACEMRNHVLKSNDIAKVKKDKVLQWLGKKETFNFYTNAGKEAVWAELEKMIS
ncbi:bifunctional precorrin-2 dehydrogenase/sirohydrochlorin ferrochelatase [Candidatus Latescibacterota bacterium]